MIFREKPKKYFGKNDVEAFVLQAERLSDRPLVLYREDGIYVSKSWKEMKNEVDAIAAYLTSAGIKKGDRVAIYSYNCWQWWTADLAVLSVGGVTVPIYATNSAEETRYVLDHSGARICFTGTTEQLAVVKSVKKKIHGLKTNITFVVPRSGGMIFFLFFAITGYNVL
jgi:long-chain acyl-CoA synthetase